LKILISNTSPDPIYQQIMDQLKTYIIKGELTEGKALPSIRNLAKELQISVITTKRAYEELEREGFIKTVQGKGSYVSIKNEELMYENQLRGLEEKLIKEIETAKLIGISLNELLEMIQLLYEEV
jgi:GntR family transcriptional regulator